MQCAGNFSFCFFPWLELLCTFVAFQCSAKWFQCNFLTNGDTTEILQSLIAISLMNPSSDQFEVDVTPIFHAEHVPTIVRKQTKKCFENFCVVIKISKMDHEQIKITDFQQLMAQTFMKEVIDFRGMKKARPVLVLMVTQMFAKESDKVHNMLCSQIAM